MNLATKVRLAAWALAGILLALPAVSAKPAKETFALGNLFATHCIQCHGKEGKVKGKVKDKDTVTYKPVIALFAMAALMALAASWAAFGNLATVQAAEWFIAIAMCLLALQKLKDVEGFATMFLNYDLLAQRWVRYAYIYPFAEALAGVLMMAGALMWVSIPVALFIGGIGAVSVFKAVYIDKRELKCACVGGDSNVPLGFVSLTENLMMISMAVWMIFKPMGIGH